MNRHHGLRRLRPIVYFLWLPVLAGIYGAYIAFGLPHGIWNYSFRDNGDPYNPFAERFYYSCTFVGPYGEFTVPARNGHCG